MAIVVALVLLYPLASNYYLVTYVWQSTVLASTLRPVYRKSCELPVPMVAGSNEKLKIGKILLNISTQYFPPLIFPPTQYMK